LRLLPYDHLVVKVELLDLSKADARIIAYLYPLRARAFLLILKFSDPGFHGPADPCWFRPQGGLHQTAQAALGGSRFRIPCAPKGWGDGGYDSLAAQLKPAERLYLVN